MTSLVEPRRDTAAAPPARSEAPDAVELSRLPRGTRGRVHRVSASRGEQLARRLADLGLEPGNTVEVRRRAPMGDPTIYRVAGYEICLRARDAALVLVEALDDGAAA